MTAPSSFKRFKSRLAWDEIDRESVKSLLHLCLIEERGRENSDSCLGDVTTDSCKITGLGKASLVAREPMILCGIGLIPLVANAFGVPQVKLDRQVEDGTPLQPGESIGVMEGPQPEILLIERTVLNFLQKLSGIATVANRFVKILEPFGVGLLDTRKTTPGMRSLEKYATACGGGYNHRMGLYDRMLVKDNHLAAASIASPVALTEFVRALKDSQPGVLLEIEVDGLEQFEAALEGGADAVLLDNFSPDEIDRASAINDNRAVLEASGGINEENISAYAQAKPHFISSGAPIHASRWLDIGLDWE
ncbi:carboxylating nicotinate-nucleotide diphosphorylase [Verrucomicrobia bacterium]|nr:carboxylating nicotinate-nucleotide diphosphorylase [Verrucomicrobiota bacterium]